MGDPFPELALPLFLRSLPLSLGTLWHYIFLLPLVFIASLPFALLALIPIVGLIVGPAIATLLSPLLAIAAPLRRGGMATSPLSGSWCGQACSTVSQHLVRAFFLFSCVAIVLLAAKLGIRPADQIADSGLTAWLPRRGRHRPSRAELAVDLRHRRADDRGGRSR